ncbi:hypothetical protein XELAEV_18034308mg [Xenopus laevis]|uniref:C-type lectin domain-containing protein n=1 Tax=Xenopus laevis TaxID=8355 RepID=A0A974HAZ8_XENLA|nr:hypothetical protein XELAEV_18034308mg [Xenopus laevis]
MCDRTWARTQLGPAGAAINLIAAGTAGGLYGTQARSSLVADAYIWRGEPGCTSCCSCQWRNYQAEALQLQHGRPFAPSTAAVQISLCSITEDWPGAWEEGPSGSSICFSSRHVPLLPAVSTIVFLFIVIVGLAVSFHTGAPEPCSSCKPCGYSAPCEEDWIWYRGKCYYFSETYDEWNNSQNFCASHNASLSLIDSQEELDFLIRHKDIADHWIGLYRDAEGIMWVWANGSKFKNTFRIEGRSPCVYLSDNHLVSTSCHRDKKWICNKLEPNVHRNVFRRRQ